VRLVQLQHLFQQETQELGQTKAAKRSVLVQQVHNPL
jgi:hypothetical protein